jgi:hypothetical protein
LANPGLVPGIGNYSPQAFPAFCRAFAVQENNFAATPLKPNRDNFGVRFYNVNSQALSQRLPQNVSSVLSSLILPVFPSLVDWRVGPERNGLILLGSVLLLLGLLWLKAVRRTGEQPSISSSPIEPLPEMTEMEPEWIEVELISDSAVSETRDEAHIGA